MGAVHTLSLTEAAYIAGIIDGEGTVTLTRIHRNEGRRLVVSISNNERALLDYVQSAVGVGRITNKRTYSDAHAPSFTYQVSSRQALDLLRQVAPYLQTYKAARARMALAGYLLVTPRNGKYTVQMQDARSHFEQEFLAVSASQKGPPTRSRANVATAPISRRRNIP